jgi:uncharacterized protein (UPF0332 family)
MTKTARSDVVEAELRVAARALEEAEVLRKAGLVGGSLSRLYFAALRWAKALLAADGIEVRSHRGLKSVLSQHFVRTGRLEVEHAQTLARLETWRDDADYDSHFVEDAALLETELAATLRLRDRILDLLPRTSP